jgi:hypothetical protein
VKRHNDGIKVAQCDGKERFDSHEQASKVAGRKSRRHEMRANVYHCRICGGFHIGNRPRFRKKTLGKPE